MAHRYDVSLKALFLREGDGIIRRRLFGGRVVEYLATEQPQVSNNRADMVVRTEDGALHQVEFQAANEPGFGLRMLGYYAWLAGAWRAHIVQTVLYLGREPLRLESAYTSPSLDFRFEIVNLRELDAEPLLASADWADVALALLAKGDREKALAAAVERLRSMRTDERAWASGTLTSAFWDPGNRRDGQRENEGGWHDRFDGEQGRPSAHPRSREQGPRGWHQEDIGRTPHGEVRPTAQLGRPAPGNRLPGPNAGLDLEDTLK